MVRTLVYHRCLPMVGHVVPGTIPRPLHTLRTTPASLVRCVLRACVLVRRKDHNAPKQMAALEETCRLHFDSLKAFQTTGVKRVDVYEYYNKLNPEFLLDIAKEYLAQVGPSPIQCTQQVSSPYPVFTGALCDPGMFPKEGCRLPRTW
jgi:hypothetical protein